MKCVFVLIHALALQASAIDGNKVSNPVLHFAADDTDSSSMASAVLADADSAQFETNQAEDEAERIAKQVEKEMTAEDQPVTVTAKPLYKRKGEWKDMAADLATFDKAAANQAKGGGVVLGEEQQVTVTAKPLWKRKGEWKDMAADLATFDGLAATTKAPVKVIAEPTKAPAKAPATTTAKEEAKIDDTAATKEADAAGNDSMDAANATKTDEKEAAPAPAPAPEEDDSKDATKTDEKEDDSKEDEKEDEAAPAIRGAKAPKPAQRRIPNMRHQKEAGEGYQQGSPLYRRQQRIANQKAGADKDEEKSAAMQHIPLLGLLAAASTLAAHFY